MNKKRFFLFKIILLIFLMVPPIIWGQELLPMPKPTHTEEGVPISKLSLVKEIKSDCEENFFYAVPWELAVSKDYFYCYDGKLAKCLIFDSKYKYVGQFLEKGQGPGEIYAGNHLGKSIRVASDGTLYLMDPDGDRLIQFSPTGKYIKDYKMFRLGKAFGGFPPIFDKEGNLYALSIHNGIVDKLNLKSMEVLHTYLSLEENDRYVLYKPPLKEVFKDYGEKVWLKPSKSDTMYDFTPDGYFLIYLFRSSRMSVFKGTKLLRQFDIFIDRVLDIYKKRVEKAIEKQKIIENNMSIVRSIMFFSCFIDHDEPFFYLQFREMDKSLSLFKFNLTGQLIEVIKNIHADIKVKKNNLFYGFSLPDRNPAIYKKENK